MRTPALALGLATVALLGAAGSASAGEIRLSSTQLDSVTAGDEFFGGSQDFAFGPNDNFQPVGSSFGGFPVFEGPLNEPPPPPPPVVPGPGGGGGGGFNLGNLIAALLGLR